VNGDPAVDGRLPETVAAAFVKQEDLFYPYMTVRETLVFAARLRLPRATPLKEKLATVEKLLTQLGLQKCAETLVGDAKVRGVSGGERKRLAIACELISQVL
jgi:ABC-type multidrug transport system ATPase subunit